jgi:AbiTii
MSLLHDIQNGATEDSVSLGSLLRKTKLLAARIGVKEISEWAERELSGYDDNEELPPYRGPFEATVLGDAVGIYGRELRNFPIPPMALSERVRDGFLFKLYFMQGVTELESLAASKETLRAPWPSDAVAAFPILAEGGTVKIDSTMTWIEIWKPIPYPTIIGVLDAIRTRLLDFTMQLGEEEPSVEREQRITDPERVERAANVFHTTVYANSANVALGNRDVTQTQQQSTSTPSRSTTRHYYKK